MDLTWNLMDIVLCFHEKDCSCRLDLKNAHPEVSVEKRNEIFI